MDADNLDGWKASLLSIDPATLEVEELLTLKNMIHSLGLPCESTELVEYAYDHQKEIQGLLRDIDFGPLDFWDTDHAVTLGGTRVWEITLPENR